MEQEPRPLYPERASSNVAEKVNTLKDILEGREAAWEVSEAEKTEILQRENELGETLENINAITPRSAGFNLNYFQTAEGLTDFIQTTGIDTPPELAQDPDGLKRFLYEKTEEIAAVDPKILKPFTGRSELFREHEILSHLNASLKENGDIDIAHIPPGHSVSMRLTPELDYEKTKQLRDLKAHIKEIRRSLEDSAQSEDYKAMLGGVYDLYQRKINEFIADRASVFASIQKKAHFLGTEALSEAEQLAQSQDKSSGDIDATLGKYDKFLTGTSDESTEAGWQKQVGTELSELADQQEELFIENLLRQKEGIAVKGLSPEKLFAETISPEEVEAYCEETLAHYDLLSTEPASEYSPSRPGPAADGKWQIIVKDSYKSLSVNGKQKVIKCPNKPQSVDRLLGVSIAHEIEGHALQHTNRSNIPLRLFEKIGSDRSSIFAEAGAVSNEDHVKHTAFGYHKVTHPHYIRAMLKKHEGGTYAECLDSYYQSAIKGLRIRHESGTLSPVEFEQACLKQLQEAINRTGRLFRGGASRTDANPHIAESKATVYLEQTKLAAELKKNGLEKALNLTGVNLDALAFLLIPKMIDLEEIKTPDFYSLELWEKMKSGYTAEQAEAPN